MANPESGGLLGRRLATALRSGSSFRLTSGDQCLDAASLLRQATDFQRWLGSRDRAAARVLIRARNSGQYVVALLGTLLAGGVPMLLDPLTSDAALAELIVSCGVDLVLDDATASPLSGHRPGAPAPTGHGVTAIEHPGTVPALAPGTELCRFTSGSTRTAAGIEFSGAAVLAAAESWIEASRLTDRDRLLCFAGLYNGLAFNTSLIPGLLSGASLTLPTGLPAGGYVRRQLAATQPTVLVAFPAIYDALAESSATPAGVARLRLSLSSAARLSPDTARTLAVRDGLRVSDYYGLAETGPVTLELDPAPDGGQGRPLPRAELRFATEVGHEREILVRTPSMGTRYLNYPGGFEAKLTP
ncbi:MAG TPA: AMP-binding protein, partial [Jatrophihabitans sp.]|nr:AMP-binding protein [Jatrophihabitans sp.]